MSRIDPLVQALATMGSRPIGWDEGDWLFKLGPYVLFEAQQDEARWIGCRLEEAWRDGWLHARWVVAGLPVLKLGPGRERAGLVFRLYAPELEEAGWRQRRKARRDLSTLARYLSDETVLRSLPSRGASTERERRKGCEHEQRLIGWGHLSGAPLDGLLGRGRIVRRIDPETKPVVAALAERRLTAVYAAVRHCPPVFIFMAPFGLGDALALDLQFAQHGEITLNAWWRMEMCAKNLLWEPLLMPFVLTTEPRELLPDSELGQDLAMLAEFIRTRLDDSYGHHWWLRRRDGQRGYATTDAVQT